MPEKDEEAQRPEAEDAIANIIARWWQQKQEVFHITATGGARTSGSAPAQIIRPSGIPTEEAFGTPQVVQYPEVLLQSAVVVFGDKTNEGQLIREVAIPWFEIIRHLDRDPDFMFRIPSRKLEEIIAGAYERAGFPEVILTPRSGDRGRDVIATRPGVGCIRIVDQVKAYKRGHRVTADEVRSVLGVLQVDRNVSKGVITTTSQFAPGILKDEDLKAFVPYRLELKDGPQLVRWLKTLLPGAEGK